MRRWGVLAAVVAATALTACNEPPPVTIAESDPGPLHVHGLDIDPADGSLYVATHTGLFRAEAGREPERVGERRHDLMGFTVAGPGDLVASGHPDLTDPTLQRPDAPPLLGLVQSADGGRSWEELSLLGEVDFHALEVAYGQVYGSDATSGRFLVSADRRTWETRSTPALLDFAVGPDDEDVILGVTEGGTVRSDDGGRTWRPLPSPPLVSVAWVPGGVIGLAGDGQVFSGGPDAGRWEPVGSAGGQPEALEVEGDVWYAAVAERGVVRSDDGGVTWVVQIPTARE